MISSFRKHCRGVLLVAFLPLSALTSCATVVHGSSQLVTVSSNPTGARVEADGSGSWTTPATIKLARKRDHVLTVTKAGYRQENIQISHVISGAVAGNILLGGFVGWGVDAMTGAQWRLLPEAVNVQLQPATGADTGGTTALTDRSPRARLKNLKSLHDESMISNQEYGAMRLIILNEIAPTRPVQTALNPEAVRIPSEPPTGKQIPTGGQRQYTNPAEMGPPEIVQLKPVPVESVIPGAFENYPSSAREFEQTRRAPRPMQGARQVPASAKPEVHVLQEPAIATVLVPEKGAQDVAPPSVVKMEATREVVTIKGPGLDTTMGGPDNAPMRSAATADVHEPVKEQWPNPNIRVEGVELADVHLALSAAGHSVMVEWGHWGPKTTERVRRFQMERDIPVTEIIDEPTWGKLKPYRKKR